MAFQSQRCVIVGTYEHIIKGFTVEERSKKNVKDDDDKNSKLSVAPFFADQPHLGTITSLCSSTGGIFLSGSSDETIKVFNLNKCVEIGGLFQHNGTITSICCYQDHVLSGGEDGLICIWRKKDWECMKTLKAHQNGVLSLSIHPSGKIALSIGKDAKLKMWDLMKGICIFEDKLRNISFEIIHWDLNGNTFAISGSKTITVFNTEMSIIHSFEHETTVVDFDYYKESCLAVGLENGNIVFWDVNTKEKLNEIKGEQKRIRSLSVFPKLDEKDESILLAAVTSDEFLLIIDAETAEILSATYVNLRPTKIITAIRQIRQNKPTENLKKEEKQTKKSVSFSKTEPTENKATKRKLVFEDAETPKEAKKANTERIIKPILKK